MPTASAQEGRAEPLGLAPAEAAEAAGRLRANVALALRPEKIHVDKDEPAQPHNKVRGTIEEIAYFGSHSVFHVRLPGGTKILANMINSQRWASEKFTWNDNVWLSWGDQAGVVLTS